MPHRLSPQSAQWSSSPSVSFSAARLHEMTCGHDVNSWTTETIDINYRKRDRKPTTIIVVASSSKYGDYFTGGEGSLLQIDNLELLY